MSKKWYVVHTYSGHENKVKVNLEKAIHSAGLAESFGQILVATEEFVEMKDGKRKTSKRKTFPWPAGCLGGCTVSPRTMARTVANVAGRACTRYGRSRVEPAPASPTTSSSAISVCTGSS